MLKDIFYVSIGMFYEINKKIKATIEDGKNLLKEKNVGEYISSEVTKKKESVDKLVADSLNGFLSKIGIATKEDIEKLKEELKNFQK